MTFCIITIETENERVAESCLTELDLRPDDS